MSEYTAIHSEDATNWSQVHLSLKPFEGVPLVSIYEDAFGQADVYKGVVMTAHQFDMLVAHVHAMRAEGKQVPKPKSPFIPIGDIPEEWKDGRKVDLLLIDFYGSVSRHTDCFFSRAHHDWFEKPQIGYSSFHSANITHVMLPPTLPESEEA